MQRPITTIAIIFLWSAAYAPIEQAPTDSQLIEARRLFAEGQKFKKAGRYAEAVPLVERTLELRESSLGAMHLEVANCLSLLSDIHRLLGNYTRAEQFLERALAIREATLGRSHLDVATTLNNLAVLYAVQGLYARAEPPYELEFTTSEDLPNDAIAFYDHGFYIWTRPPHERALVIREASFGASRLQGATSPNYLDVKLNYSLLRMASARPGTISKVFEAYHSIHGHYDRAEPLYARALAIYEAALGASHPDVATSLSNLASLYKDQGHYARAEVLYNRALAIREAALGKNHPEVAYSLNNLATLYKAQGHYDRAKPLYERALAIWEAALGKNHPDIAISLHNLANLHMEQGFYEQAFSLYERALAIWEAALGKNHPELAFLLNSLARLHLAQNDLVKAVPLFTRAFEVAEEHLRQEVFSFSEVRLDNLLKLLREDEEILYALVHEYPDDARLRHLALTAALLRKGRSVAELASIAQVISRSLSQVDREAFERLRALRTQLSESSLSGPGMLSPADYQQRLTELTAKADALEEELSRRSAPLRAHYALPPAAEVINHVAKAIPKDGALVEFIAYHDSPLIARRGTPPSQRTEQLRYLALVLFTDGGHVALDLGPAEFIDTAAVRLHHALAHRSVSYQPAAQVLYNLVFRTLLPHLRKVQRLFLSTDGELALVSFAALQDSRRRFLLDSWNITYLASGIDLLPRSGDISPAASVVIFADPKLGLPDTAFLAPTQAAPTFAKLPLSSGGLLSSRFVSSTDHPWPPLPGTRKEAEAIHRLFPQAQLFLGPAATKHALLTLSAPGILHIATHGFFYGDEADEAGPFQFLPNSSLRSGLVLLGANSQQHQPGLVRREDSFITALEFASMDLWGTQLVVLSACDTGRGEIKFREGVYGLRRTLAVAGAESLVASLWTVNDESTSELMENYYSNLLSAHGRASALRQAMRALRQKYPHPYFWAPFILIGKDAPLQGLAPSMARSPASTGSTRLMP